MLHVFLDLIDNNKYNINKKSKMEKNMGIIKNTVKKITALSLAFVMSFSVLTAIKSPLKVDAAFEAKHYDLTQNGGYWDGVNYELNGEIIKDAFFTDGKYTYFLQADGTPMKDRLTYHPDGVHVIYFDKYGHEVFSNFKNVKQSIAGDAVNDLCFFDVYGYMYTNFLTYDQAGVNLYYANPYGVMECNGWFQFAGDAGPVAEAFGITEGTWGYAYPNGIVDPASIGDDSVYSSFIPNQEMMFAYNLDDGIDDSSLYFRYKDSVDATEYTYEIIPLLEPFNRYFYIKTNNPDPNSFAFRDKTSVYDVPGASGGYKNIDEEEWTYYENDLSITPLTNNEFFDVLYEDSSIGRVKGGYIAESQFTDGGEVYLQKRIIQRDYNGNVYYITKDTDITINIPNVVDSVDYLIENYSLENDFWGSLDSIQDYLDSAAIYPKSFVDIEKPNEQLPYPYFTCSSYPELSLNDIYNMYERADGSCIAYRLYPFILDSLGFPGMMASVAKRLDDDCEYERGEDHYDVNITHNGEMRTYGGCGGGGFSPMYKDFVEVLFLFDNSKDDYAFNVEIESLSSKYREYNSLSLKRLSEYKKMLYGDEAKNTIFPGAWLRVRTEGWSSNPCYTYVSYVYGDNYRSEIEDTWVDGRYISVYNQYYPGVKYGDILFGVDTGKSDILIRNMEYTDYNGEKVKRDVLFEYREDTDDWKAAFSYVRDASYVTSILDDMPDEMVLTHEEIEEMNKNPDTSLDRNTDIVPQSGFIYDGTVKPGTPFTN